MRDTSKCSIDLFWRYSSERIPQRIDLFRLIYFCRTCLQFQPIHNILNSVSHQLFVIKKPTRNTHFLTFHILTFCSIICRPVFLRFVFSFFVFGFPSFVLVMFRPEFSYRPGLGPVSEDTTTTTTTPLTHGSGGPPNRPLPPTPDDDDQAGDRTLIMKRVSSCHPTYYIYISSESLI